MKRLTSTLIIGVLAACSLVLFLYQSGNGQLAGIIGKPALKEGASLLKMNRKEIFSFRVTHDAKTAYYEKSEASAGKENTGWMRRDAETAVRADYRKIEKLLFMLESATVLTDLPRARPTQSYHLRLDRDENSKNKPPIEVTLHRQLPRYTGVEPLLPVFSVTIEGKTYACTSDLEEFFPVPSQENLLDKHPFYFHPSYACAYSYPKGNAEVVLKRNSIKEDWKITTPIPLRADQKSVKKLISSLYSLEAEEVVFTESSPTLSSVPLLLKSSVPSLPDQLIHLSEDLKSAYNPALNATYRFREKHALSSLMPEVDSLRAKTLLKLDLGQVDSVLLQSKAQPYPVVLAIQKGPAGQPRWMFQTAAQWLPADEINIAQLITALTKTEVQEFSLLTFPSGTESEKSVTVFLKNGKKIQLDFYKQDGAYLAHLQGSAHSSVLSPSHFQRVKTEPQAWFLKKLWNFSPITLRGIQRRIKGRPLENYSYNFNLEQWKGQIGEQRVDEEFDPVTATNFLNFLESLQVESWLSAQDPFLLGAPGEPVLTLTTLSENYDENGDSLGMRTRTLTVMGKKTLQDAFLIKLETEGEGEKYALLKEDLARRLATSLIYEEE